jgi:hypothetical protein
MQNIIIQDLIYCGARRKGKCAKIPGVFASVTLCRDNFTKARARNEPDFTLRELRMIR